MVSLSANAFMTRPSTSAFLTRTESRLKMGIETIEYTIYPDGRVEERVRGVKGDNCHKITDEINQHLGEVVSTRPTEEMYEQEIKVEQTVTESIGESSNGTGDSWSSSW